MYIRKRNYSFLHVVSLTVLVLSILVGATLEVYVRTTLVEIFSSWLQTEAVSIQEGDLLHAVTKQSRILLSSQMVTAINLREEMGIEHQTLLEFGPTFHTNFKEEKPGYLQLNTVGFFHEQLSYRFPENPHLILSLDAKPMFARWAFAILLGIMSLFIILSMHSLRNKQTEEEEKRLRFLSKALNELLAQKPNHSAMFKEFPAFSMIWEDLKQKLNLLNNERVETLKQAAINQLVQNLAHDLKNPLAVFEFVLHSETNSDFSVLRGQMGRALITIRNILQCTIKGHESDTIKATLVTIDMSTIIEDFRRLYSQKNNVTIFLVGLDSIHAFADALGIERMLYNLVKNAVEGGAHHIIVRTTVYLSNLIFQVEDDGPGVPETIVSQLFQRGITSGKQGGSGIGLFNVSHIAKAHGGFVSYERTEDRSLFTITLPYAYVPEPVQENNTPSALPNDDNVNTKSEAMILGVLLELWNIDRLNAIISALEIKKIAVVNAQEFFNPARKILPLVAFIDQTISAHKYEAEGMRLLVDDPEHDVDRCAFLIEKIFRTCKPENMELDK